MVVKNLRKSMINMVGSYGDLIDEHLRVLKDFEKRRKIIEKQTGKK